MPACLTPDKRRFATPQAAESYATYNELGLGHRLAPYACPCGWIHLTSQAQIPDHIDADPAIVNRLRHMPTDAFIGAVKGDTAGTLDMPARIALRDPRLHGRWVTALRTIARQLDARLAAVGADDDLRQRAEVFRHNIASRITEADARRDRAVRAA